jgi:predicted ATPase
MITKWRISNFKSIREAPELELAALTIFAGANSSGKSTFIQSVLLISQTLAHKVGSRSVVLNGAFTSLGQFNDLLSSNADSKQIEIECTVKPLVRSNVLAAGMSAIATHRGILRPIASGLNVVSCRIAFDAGETNEPNDIYQIQPRLFSADINSVIRNEGVDERFYISVSRSSFHPTDVMDSSEFEEIDERSRLGFAYDVKMDTQSLSEIQEEYRSASPVGCVLRHFLPERIHFQVDSLVERSNAIAIALQGFANRSRTFRPGVASQIVIPHTVLDVLREILSELIGDEEFLSMGSRQADILGVNSGAFVLSDWEQWLQSQRPERRMQIARLLRSQENLFEKVYSAMQLAEKFETPSFAYVTESPPRVISTACRYLDSFFSSSVKYLGPLRDAPKPLYPLTPAADPNDVGLRGEHTAAILELHKNKDIKYIPSLHFGSPSIDRTQISISLETAVIDWLQYLGVADNVKSTDKGKLGHELKVGLKTSDIQHDLTHVGVGVSQVLPILVMCLLADTDSTLVFEQPELHLHPRVQSRLGDFFLSMALCKKQCIVETHSEYLIDQVRYRIAASSIEKPLNNEAKMYFVEKTTNNSSFREVKVNEFGAILDWPDGFFDQSQHQIDLILKAALEKKRAKREADKQHE